LVTLSGRSYMSRVAGSMLTSAGLSELVTTSKISYEKKIIAMLDERARQKINKKISRLRPKWPEVTKKLVQSMEVEYARILKNET
jgi:predicted O-linked N-acetylglucosamine transferase (SPINDLY family)